MDLQRPSRLMTLDQYLAFEEQSPIKHEYVAGEVYALSGVTTRHNLITLNLTRHLQESARSHGCKVFATDVKLKAQDRIYYPDVVLACGKAAEVELIIEEPSLVVEVTSPSTRATDRREKLDSYRRIPSLHTYLIVEQRRRHVLGYVRGTNGEWLRVEFVAQDEIAVPTLDVSISLDEIYDGINLPPLAVGEEGGWEEYGEDDGVW